MGSGPSRKYPNGIYVMIGLPQTGGFAGPMMFGRITGACAALARNNYEYTIAVEDNCIETVEEQHLQPLSLPELTWISPNERQVAVWVETHGEKRFLAHLVRRDEDLMFEIRFVHDNTVLESVHPAHLSPPTADTISNASPETMPPDPLWLLDRKIQANIDAFWPMQDRIQDALDILAVPRPATMPPLCGPFVGKNLFDSEAYPTHPSPLPELAVDGLFVDMWANFAGKVKFADTYKIGPAYPRFSAWSETIDANDPLYFHAALPVHAGLICLGKFQSQPEWIRASDVALVGISMYVNGDLFPGFEDPPLEKLGVQKYGHECCHFIPGCVATYLGDCAWMGAAFCFAPTPADNELRDDVYGILAYHKMLDEAYKRYGETEITLEVNLVLSTNYLANVRQVCAGVVRINLSEKAMMLSDVRLRDIQENKLTSPEALHPKRPRKILSEQTHEQCLERQLKLASLNDQTTQAPRNILGDDPHPQGAPLSLSNLPAMMQKSPVGKSPPPPPPGQPPSQQNNSLPAPPVLDNAAARSPNFSPARRSVLADSNALRPAKEEPPGLTTRKRGGVPKDTDREQGFEQPIWKANGKL